MDIKNFLNEVCKEIKYNPVRKPISEELEQHIQDRKEDYIFSGIKEEEAEEKAIKQMGNAKEIGKKLNQVHRPKLDWKLLILIFILVAYGVYMAICKQNSTNTILKDTIIYMATGLIIGIPVYFLDYRKIRRYSNLIYLIATLIIFLPAIGIGACQINGIDYFRLGGFTFHTATVTIPLFIISFVGFLTSFDKSHKKNIKILDLNIVIYQDLVKIVVFSIFSLLLIGMIPSMVSGILLGSIYLIMATIFIIKTSPNKVSTLVKMYGTMGVLVIVAIFCIGVEPYYPFERLIVSFHPELDPEGIGYIGMLQKEVLQNAKLIGEADTEIIKSDQFILSANSNFTFIYLIGKAGILPASILVIAILLIAIKIIINSKLIKDWYGKAIIIGLGLLYIMQSVISVLMNVNLGIQFNINLPFVSYGGTYFVINAISIAYILSIYRRKDINLEMEKGGIDYE